MPPRATYELGIQSDGDGAGPGRGDAASDETRGGVLWREMPSRVLADRPDTPPTAYAHQVVRDPASRVVTNQMVQHVYTFQDGLVTRNGDPKVVRFTSLV